MERKTIAVIGGGAWGTALGALGARLGHDTRIWARERDVVDEIERDHTNSPYLPGEKLPEGLRAHAEPEAALEGAALVLLVPPSKYFRALTRDIAAHVPERADVIIATKGIDEESLALMTDVLAETMPAVTADRVGVLSGPSFAKEVVRDLPTDVVVASRGKALTERAQATLHSPTFRVYASADPVGVQVGGSLKNVYAIAIGACDGLGFGANARAALMTRGLAELTRLGIALDADPLTFLGMAGVGDLILTCTGDLSRNRQLGIEIARGADPEEYLAARRSVAEGFWTSKAAHSLAQQRGVDMPITEQVYAVLHEGRSLLEAGRILMTRSAKDELHGIRDTWTGR